MKHLRSLLALAFASALAVTAAFAEGEKKSEAKTEKSGCCAVEAAKDAKGCCKAKAESEAEGCCDEKKADEKKPAAKKKAK